MQLDEIFDAHTFAAMRRKVAEIEMNSTSGRTCCPTLTCRIGAWLKPVSPIDTHMVFFAGAIPAPGWSHRASSHSPWSHTSSSPGSGPTFGGVGILNS